MDRELLLDHVKFSLGPSKKANVLLHDRINHHVCGLWVQTEGLRCLVIYLGPAWTGPSNSIDFHGSSWEDGAFQSHGMTPNIFQIGVSDCGPNPLWSTYPHFWDTSTLCHISIECIPKQYPKVSPKHWMGNTQHDLGKPVPHLSKPWCLDDII